MIAGFVLLAMTACGGAGTAGPQRPAGTVRVFPSGVPTQLLGYPLKKENVGHTLASNRQPTYFDNVQFYSLRRKDNFLEATLQIGHFKPGTDDAQTYFRQTVATGIGSTQPIATKVGNDMVYVSTQTGLVIASWFRGDYLLILSIRDTFSQPKTLIRQALELSP